MQNPTTETLRAEAQAAHAAYPQYVGYYDEWELGTLTRRIRTKGGTDLAAGTMVLTNFDRDDLDGVSVVTIYDRETTHNVCVAATDVERVSFMYRHADGLVWFTGSVA